MNRAHDAARQFLKSFDMQWLDTYLIIRGIELSNDDFLDLHDHVEQILRELGRKI